MADILVDSDVFIDHLRGHHAFRPGARRVFYSAITRAELFSGRESEEDTIGMLLSAFAEIAVDRTVAERAGRLRRRRAMTLPDALIAATALEHELTLLTSNAHDFEGIDGLRLRSPRVVARQAATARSPLLRGRQRPARRRSG